MLVILEHLVSLRSFSALREPFRDHSAGAHRQWQDVREGQTCCSLKAKMVP